MAASSPKGVVIVDNGTGVSNVLLFSPAPPSLVLSLRSSRVFSANRCARAPQFVKAGFAADNLPRFQFPSIVGRPMLRAEEEALGELELKDINVGEDAAALRRALEISYP
jgi:hypothetical protein